MTSIEKEEKKSGENWASTNWSAAAAASVAVAFLLPTAL